MRGAGDDATAYNGSRQPSGSASSIVHRIRQATRADGAAALQSDSRRANG
ncbi:hypothetical protein R69927_03055 [Paraburkholderia domus]|uniref:Uncharacterized protein n=1 Tax=Paraburkholderia domus TaxID=2793075 RepID=A0A9N8N5B8_9BURK|nr:hypothetical protein R75483_01812 [Paraburkholderia domus]CAE6742022.1 hypothetical protein R70006_02620 [Paraburkholderia domus]CAE6813499.1 hypothetical protein R69749_03192 [Paraburkholderia domus]CAE6849051.1 hypothetical protein R70199_00245 [Paraburkholderia domus]CAE6867298.1 hypothetical protein R69927_03055 [Paraburkholderia domus]